ncbi:unnamed protein product [Caenorhabditis bovis]|uniref:Ubiquitin carboxyl-terminal hydrolase n=1 Tax=Caenorhabditis bovis TaxID=2654633 RepID=A0A8S1F8E6_9PELO|nr:unnamed protein product [Caenorhabditis bovis]
MSADKSTKPTHEGSFCPHIQDFDTYRMKETIRRLKNKKKYCCYCQDVAHYICADMGCVDDGRAVYLCADPKRGHFIDHGNKTGHSLVYHVKTRSVLCVTCIKLNEIQDVIAHLANEKNPGASRSPTVSMAQMTNESDSADRSEKLFPNGLCGLVNVGNTCYLNASLQVLSNCPPINFYFLNMTPNHNTMSGRLAELIQKMWRSDTPETIKPLPLIEMIIKTMHNRYQINVQHDAQEFLKSFMESLHSQLAVPIFRPFMILGDHMEEPFAKLPTTHIVEKNPDGCSEQYYEQLKYASIITDVFEGELENSIGCSECQNVSRRFEDFQDLSIPISRKPKRRNPDGMEPGFFETLTSALCPIPVHLEDCLDEYFEVCMLDGENQYACSRCCKHVDAKKVVAISKLPEVVCIHLKRFGSDRAHSYKINTHVNFPLEDLDLSRYETGPSSSTSLYDLWGIITHEGNTPISGHYKAFCRNREDGVWYEFDDNVVTKLDGELIKKQNAYALFYVRKQNVEENQLIKQTLDENFDPNAKKCYISRKWLFKLDRFAEPGCITNYDFLCEHGAIRPEFSEYLDESVAVINDSIWQTLFEIYGGGPYVDEINQCEPCFERWKKAVSVRLFEQTSTRLAKQTYPSLTYSSVLPQNLVHRDWITTFETYLADPYHPRPRPINNAGLLTQLMRNRSHRSRPLVGPSAQQIDREVYLELVKFYGGGPEVFLTRDDQPTSDEIIKAEEIVNSQKEQFLESFPGENKDFTEVVAKTKTSNKRKHD